MGAGSILFEREKRLSSLHQVDRNNESAQDDEKKGKLSSFEPSREEHSNEHN